jgi:hypothetical protein
MCIQHIMIIGRNGQCAHEFIIDLRPFKEHGIVEEDVAKRLQVEINFPIIIVYSFIFIPSFMGSWVHFSFIPRIMDFTAPPCRGPCLVDPLYSLNFSLFMNYVSLTNY